VFWDLSNVEASCQFVCWRRVVFYPPFRKDPSLTLQWLPQKTLFPDQDNRLKQSNTQSVLQLGHVQSCHPYRPSQLPGDSQERWFELIVESGGKERIFTIGDFESMKDPKGEIELIINQIIGSQASLMAALILSSQHDEL
jgi:hypothetical protein